jgi:hypothetical protein
LVVSGIFCALGNNAVYYSYIDGEIKMAKIIRDDDTAEFGVTYEWWYVLFTGVTIGILYVGITALLQQYVIEPLYCRSVVDSAICTNSLSVAGNVASILVALAALGLFVRLRVYRPIVIVVATAVLLWGLSSWTAGLNGFEIVASSAILYGLAYLMVSWVCRYKNTIPVIVSVLLIVAGSRLIGLS